eukprot:297599-Chlamydomonas_euryale.AAC.4
MAAGMRRVRLGGRELECPVDPSAGRSKRSSRHLGSISQLLWMALRLQTCRALADYFCTPSCTSSSMSDADYTCARPTEQMCAADR